MAGHDPLRAFLAPRSVAVIGATDRDTKLGAALCRNLLDYPGPVHFVTPGRETVFGRPCYRDIGTVPDAIELALAIVPICALEAAVEGCAAAGVPALSILSGGFHELGPAGRTLKSRLAATARAAGMRLLGPNGTGSYDTTSALKATFMSLPPIPAGGVGLFGQSGALLGGLMWEAVTGGTLGLAAAVMLGDKLDIDEADVLRHFAGRADVRAVAGYIEGTDDARGLIEATWLCAATKPVVLMRGGVTEQGAETAFSHTGRLVRPSRALDGSLTLAGALLVSDLRELLGLAGALDYLSRFPGPLRRAAVATTSGGCGVVLVDHLARAGVTPAAYAPATLSRLAQAGLSGPEPSATEPVDLEIPGERIGLTEATCQAIEIVGRDRQVDLLVIALGAFDHFSDLDPARVAAAAAATGKPVFVWPYGRPDLKDAWAPALRDGVQIVASMAAMARALAAWGDRNASRPDATTPSPVVPGCVLDGAALAARLPSLPFAAGESVPIGAGDRAALAAAAARLGFPVALKLRLPDAGHKSLRGALALDLRHRGGAGPGRPWHARRSRRRGRQGLAHPAHGRGWYRGLRRHPPPSRSGPQRLGRARRHLCGNPG